MVEPPEQPTPSGAFWSGTITFGLVSIQVDLYSAHRPRAMSLQLVDQEGSALRRRYFCPRDHQSVDQAEIVRGYEVEEGKYIQVTEEELVALEPKKSREIDLHSFVDRADLDPVAFQRAYLLLPAGSVNKAYRLLADIMERSGRAGIATFVMRDREYLVAILAEGGILRAETLRFPEEIRTPAAIGLPALESVPDEKVKQLHEEMKKLLHQKFDPSLLRDQHAERLRKLIRRKLATGEDVMEKEGEEAKESGEIIDLMEIIKNRFNLPPAAETRKTRGRARRKKPVAA